MRDASLATLAADEPGTCLNSTITLMGPSALVSAARLEPEALPAFLSLAILDLPSAARARQGRRA